MGARFLDVALGRWLSADSIVPNPADPQSFNRYSWVVGNPLRFVDPSGHAECETGDSESCRGRRRRPRPPEPSELPSSIVVSTLEELQQESAAMLLARMIFGEAGGGPPERWIWYAASVIVRAEQDFGWHYVEGRTVGIRPAGFGASVHAQLLEPGQYGVFGLITGYNTEDELTGSQVAVNKKTLDPTRENDGEGTFEEIYSVSRPNGGCVGWWGL